MKIIHNAPNTYQSRQQRDKNGKYKKQKGSGKILAIIILAIIVVFGYKAYFSRPVTIQTIEVKSSNDLTEEQQIKLKQQYDLSIKETALMNKKEKLDAEYKSQSASIETELESIRSQKLSFK